MSRSIQQVSLLIIVLFVLVYGSLLGDWVEARYVQEQARLNTKLVAGLVNVTIIIQK